MGCRGRVVSSELLRVVAVVVGESRAVVPDPQRRRPGRGAWVHPDPECLRRAERRRAFPRALRVPGPVDVSAVERHLGQNARSIQTDVGLPPRPAAEGSRSTRHEAAVKLKP
ncbi:YlxR family protein [Actinoalloteichus spitiensis]|uniref:YlxR family protein n=1 Tax=Actinoalloteichus spitiensis TaxID=252394 RepID=UPI00315D38D2